MTGGETPRQLPLDLEPSPGYSPDDLVVTKANAAAAGFIQRWPDWPSPVVVLAGPPGSGKSHLAAIWSEASAAVALDAADLSSAANPAPGPFVVEDADRADLDQTGLFHLINTVRGSDSTLLLTARRFPAAWGVTLPDLASRLKASTVIEIGEPDDDLLGGVITKLFADRQIEVDPQVIQFLVRRMERSLATARGLVARLDAAALERKSPVTRALAAQVMTDLDEGQGAFELE